MPCSASAATILRDRRSREDARVDARVERLHAPAEQLREARDVLDRRHREPCLRERGRRAPARHELEAELGEPARERREARLVVDGDQRAHSSRTTFGRSRCSASCTRSRSVSTVSPVEHRDGLARDHLARVDAVVDVVDRRGRSSGPGREHVLERMRARELGERRRMHVHDTLREPLEERRARAGACSRRRRRARRRGSRASPPSPRRAHPGPRTRSSGNAAVDDARSLGPRERASTRRRSTRPRRPEGRRRAAPAGSSPRRSRAPRSRAYDPSDHELVAGIPHDRDDTRSRG